MILNFTLVSHISRYAFVLLGLTLLASCALFTPSSPYQYQSHEITSDALVIRTASGKVKFSALASNSIEVLYQDTTRQLPSFAIKDGVRAVNPHVVDEKSRLTLTNGSLKAVINKSDLSVSYFRNGEFLTRQTDYFREPEKKGFNFELSQAEKILGGGQRVLGMNRRGHRMPLYNRAHYGYTTESNQMYFSLPAVMSNKKYALLFDNTASGFLDIGKTESNTLTFEAVGGRSAYIVFAGDSYPELINHYVDVTGKQPLPPRWAFGNYASRFGYKTEQQVRETVDKFIEEDFPLDAIILDLYWFGPDVKGHVGNLDWDNNTFPTPKKMIADLKEKGVKTILITEPFVLSSSKKWQNAVEEKVLAKDLDGDPRRFDFYFGNTGLIDVFDEKAQDWFWNIYQGLFEQGVAGTWGDLGEPEVHPDDSIHLLSETGESFRGDELHNAFGHQWARLVYDNQRKLQPNSRPFIMMRSGFAGSQRFGMIPWTGDVSRSWGGLKPQVELSLQMGLLGMAYTHSDLGGFAGGEAFDKEMYIRWLQYGVFQPVYRPHAQDNIAPEPIFHDEETKDITREFIKLRYRLLPYLYTMAYQNSTTGMPLMRPLFFEDEENASLFDEKDNYLWGDSFLVSPITEAGETHHRTKLPEGIWFDFWDDSKYQGGRLVDVPVSMKKIPVLVRAGAFVPMIDDIKSSRDYSTNKLTLHYYADESVMQSSGEMYEDDGESFGSIEKGRYDLLAFSASRINKELAVAFQRNGKGYQAMPKSRRVEMLIHNWESRPKEIKWNGQRVDTSQFSYDAANKILKVEFDWSAKNAKLLIQ